MTLQQEENEILCETISRTAIHTGFELTDKICANNKERKASARTAREKERIRKSIQEENRLRYRNHRISIQILLTIEEEKQGNTRPALLSNQNLARAVQAYCEPGLGGVSRAAERTPNETSKKQFSGIPAAPLRAESSMNQSSSLAPDYSVSHKQSSSGLRLCCKRTLVISTVIFVIVMILIFLRIFDVVDIFGPLLPEFI